MNPHIVPASQHTLFMRGFHPNTEMNRIRDFFTKEGGKCSFDFFKVSQDASRLFVALRFESREVAKDILSRFDNSTVLGSKIAITWFKDLRRARLKAIQHGQQWNYRYNSRNGYNRNFNKYGSYHRMKSTVWQRRSSKDYEARRGSSSSRSRSRSRSRSHYSRSRSRSYSRTRSRSRSRGSRSSSPSRSRSHSRNRSVSPRPHRQRSHSSTSSRGSSHEQPGAKYWKDNEPQPPVENDKPKESDAGNQPEAREEGEVNSETQGDGIEGSVNEKGEMEKRNKRSRSSSLEFMRKTERSSSRSSSPSDPSDPKERRKKKKKHRRSKHHRHHRRHSRRRHRSSSDEGQKSDFDAEQLERMCRLGGSQEPSNPISVHHMDGMDDEELELLMNLPSKDDSPKSPRMADAVSRESDGMSPLHVSEGDDEQPNDSLPKLVESQVEINSVEKEQKNEGVVNNIPSVPVEPEEKERDIPANNDNNSIANVNSDTNAASEEKTSPKIGKATSVKINPSSKSLLEKYKSSLKHQVPTPAASLKKLSFKQKKAEEEPEKSKSIFPTKEVNSNSERPTQLSEFQITRIKMKKAEMEETYRQDTETFATVVKMLISKDPSLEEKVQYSLRENLRDIARRCINELQEFIDSIHDS